MLHVTEARYLDGFRLWLAFDDGRCGVMDLEKHLWGPMFAPLKDKRLFRQVRVDPELETIVWPNGADLAPEFLHDNLVADQAQCSVSR